MNAVEHIVEAYFRICRRCFTMHDVKVPNGNNRQLDMLAACLESSQQYHVESSVMHGFPPSTKELKDTFDKKFLGVPARREGKNTDYAKGKSFKGQIENAYRLFGLDPAKVIRVWVTWAIEDPENLSSFLAEYQKENGMLVEVISLRDGIIPELQKEVGTANYDDEVLRTLSLLKQKEIQTQPPAPGDAAGPRA